MLWNKDIAGPTLEVAGLPGTPIRVLAGPGTGKSFALKRRVTRLLEEGAPPTGILAVTFTRMAAKDMVTDLKGLGVPGCEEVRTGTLHSLCFSMLNQEQVLQLTGRTPRTMLRHEVKYLIRDLPSQNFGSIKQREHRLGGFESAWARLQHEQPGWPSTAIEQQFQDAVVAWLKFHRAMLVAEMVTEALRYLRDNPAAPERSMFNHVLVDEYQDLNKAEQALTDLLAANGDLAILGDDDQSIYGFKYANPEGIIEFPTTHKGTHALALTECHRCPVDVVRIANALISHNKVRVAKKLDERQANGAGEIHILQWGALAEEADGIAKIVAAKVSDGTVKPEQVIVLAPRKLIAYPIRDALVALGLDVQLGFEDETLSTVSAQERFSLLNLLADANDRVALRVLMGYGAADGRAAAWNRLRSHCEASGQSPWEALDLLANGNLKLPYLNTLVQRFQTVRTEAAALTGMNMGQLLDAWIPAGFPATEQLRSLAAEVLPTVINTGEFFREMKTRLSQPEIPDATGRIRVMSLHKSKGLTAEMVVVVGCVEGLIPAQIPQDDPESARKLEEFRRLFYVAITRTRRILVISGALRAARSQALQMGANFIGKGNLVKTISSRFIAELGPAAPAPTTGKDILA